MSPHWTPSQLIIATRRIKVTPHILPSIHVMEQWYSKWGSELPWRVVTSSQGGSQMSGIYYLGRLPGKINGRENNCQ